MMYMYKNVTMEPIIQYVNLTKLAIAQIKGQSLQLQAMAVTSGLMARNCSEYGHVNKYPQFAFCGVQLGQ